MSQEFNTISRLREEGISLTEKLGQHMLIDEGILNMVASQVEHGSNVLEIGSGPGNLTRKIAPHANKVVGIEIDSRFSPLLSEVESAFSNVNIDYRSALDVNFERVMGRSSRKEWQIVSNLPFHISEPFLFKIINLPIKDAVLVVGDELARKMQIENPNDPEFSRTSLIAQTFFDTSTLLNINSDSFHPRPRTHAALVVLRPRDKREFMNNPRKAILRNLFLTERRNPTVLNVIKESTSSSASQPLLSKTANHRRDRRRFKQELRQVGRGSGVAEGGKKRGNSGTEVEKLGLSNTILSKPFSRLDNQELRELTSALMRVHG